MEPAVKVSQFVSMLLLRDVRIRVLDLGLGPCDRFMSLRQLLHGVDAGPQRIMVELRRLDPEHVQDPLCILWIFLVPAIVQPSRVRAGEEPITAAVSPETIDLGKIQRQVVRQRRHQHLETRFSQAPCYRPVIVPVASKSADHRAAVGLQARTGRGGHGQSKFFRM